MKIEQIFAKRLTRDINGVVKAEQIDNESVFVELDEYVVTKELARHMRNFFETYTPAVKGHNPAMAGKIGVWVSGFFGSGKSHFIKMLSYLLENRTVEHQGVSKKALEFFDDKIQDAMLKADIHSATTRPVDVILFNIDSQANTDDGDNAILKVFLKMFNVKAGYCADYAHIAYLERELDKRGQYQAFQQAFGEETGLTWQDERDAFDFYRDEMIRALSSATGQSVDSTRQWIDQLEQKLPLNITNFCQWGKEYLDRHDDRNLVFLVDEVGQFIGKNTQMMLQLQTITENLGVICGGRAWVIVTSQADIDAAIGQLSSSSAQDFSKIQGRFHTRLQLSSSNTSEVIQRRLLEKVESAGEHLSALYAGNSDILRNQLSFDSTTTADLKSFTDNTSFVDNYPFVPYHYLLVQKVFESIRAKGATGKHLAMGERSLLDAFQSAAKQIKDKSLGALIPFFSFYAPIEGFLEPAVKRTIDQAGEKESLSTFDNQILKTLFLIRYVDVVRSTIDNLVTLSIDCIDADKIVLKKQIEEALVRLERELLIARNGDEYLFLTNEEKEIENEIRHTDIEASEKTSKLSDLIFSHLLKNQKNYRYPVNKQDFQFSRFCNGHPKDGATLEDLVLKVTSPLDPLYPMLNEPQCISQSLDPAGCMLFKLGENKPLWDELEIFIKTDRFLKINSGQRPEQEQLLREKAVENSAREKRLHQEFGDLFAAAEVYAIGQRLQLKSSSPQSMIDEACRYVVDNSFSKLSLLRPFSGDIKRELAAVLTADDAGQLGLDLTHTDNNPDASREVEQFITLKGERSEPVYLKDVLHKFSHRPFGWNEEEIVLLVARLALAGKITFTLQHQDLLLKSAYDTLTSIRKRGDVRIQRVRRHDEQQLRRAVNICKTIFNKTINNNNEKELSEQIRRDLQRWRDQLKSFKAKAETGQFPGKAEIETGLQLVAGILDQSTPFGLIQRFVEEERALGDFSEDFENIEDFFTSQIGVWQKLGKELDQFKPNKHILSSDEEAQKALNELEQIRESAAPYGRLNQVDRLIETVQRVNSQVLEKHRSEVLAQLDELIESLKTQLITLPQDLSNKALYPIQQCKKRVEATSSIHQLRSELQEAGELEDQAINILNRYVEQQTQLAEQQLRDSPVQTKTDAPFSAGATTQTSTITPKPKAVPRKVVVVSPKELIGQTGGFAYLDNEADVENYLAQLRDKLMAVVGKGDRVRIK